MESALTIFILLFLATAGIVVWRESRWRKSWRTIRHALHLPDVDDSFTSSAKAARLIDELRQQAGGKEKQNYLRELFESLLNEIRQGVVIVDEGLRIKFANEPLSILFPGQTFRRDATLIEEFRDHQIVEAVRESLSEKKRVVRQIRTQAGQEGGSGISERVLLVEASPLPGNQEHSAWMMIHDVTEEVMTEQIRKDFVANASHELRTPLTLINGYIETLQTGVISDQAGLKRCLDIMEKHGKRLVRIIEDMLTISRLESPSAVLKHDPFPVRACVQDVLDHLAPLVETRKAAITLHFPKDGGILNGDRFYWDQVFMNLIENALKENTRPGLKLSVSGEWHASECVLKVTDNGVGIPAHDVPFIFKRFYRGQKHHGGGIKGTGLGLSIVRRAVEAHGGIIELQSTPGIETSFIMRVPLRREDGDSNDEPSILPEPPARGGVLSQRFSASLVAARKIAVV
jgi:two-component system, OmpR family, phosphate regulon sensor histidine kinase PhoR